MEQLSLAVAHHLAKFPLQLQKKKKQLEICVQWNIVKDHLASSVTRKNSFAWEYMPNINELSKAIPKNDDVAPLYNPLT